MCTKIGSCDTIFAWDLFVRTLNLLEENMGINLLDMGQGNEFWGIIPKPQAMK